MIKEKKAQLRARARSITLDALSTWQSMTGGEETLERPRVYLPYLHEIPKNEEPAFRDFLALLSKDHIFISYSEAIDRALNGPIDRPYVAFSFDDGFASNVSASKILEEFGAVGCFFVPPGFIDTQLSTVQAMKEFGFSQGTCEAPMTWHDLEQMKSRGHEIGNHTMNHRTLSSMTEAEVFDEIAIAAERIRAVLGECHHFAWPRGRFEHMSAMAVRTVFDTGHASCASAERGAHLEPLNDDRRLLCVRRDHIMTSWPLRHNRYFVAKASKAPPQLSNHWPHGWSVTP